VKTHERKKTNEQQIRQTRDPGNPGNHRRRGESRKAERPNPPNLRGWGRGRPEDGRGRPFRPRQRTAPEADGHHRDAGERRGRQARRGPRHHLLRRRAEPLLHAERTPLLHGLPRRRQPLREPLRQRTPKTHERALPLQGDLRGRHSGRDRLRPERRRPLARERIGPLPWPRRLRRQGLVEDGLPLHRPSRL